MHAHDFGRILDYLNELGVSGNTIVIFAGDNGPEDHLAGRGTAGFFDGSYFSSAEGGIRTPCLIRWPGMVPARESNEMVHVTDMFTTLLQWAGCEPPSDRIIDGIDQREFFGGDEASRREGSLVWLNEELHAVKWSQFKISFKRQQHFHDPEIPLGFARIINLLEDPKEREPVNQTFVRWWVMQHARRIMQQFEESTAWPGEFPWQRLAADYDGTSPVRSFPANGYGLYDMAGNVWEWTADRFSTPSPGGPRPPCCSGESIPDGEAPSGIFLVVKGARISARPTTAAATGPRPGRPRAWTPRRAISGSGASSGTEPVRQAADGRVPVSSPRWPPGRGR